MLEKSLEILKSIEAKGFECYIVGGFVRDYCMKKDSYDVDICTSARPKDLINIFDNAVLPKEKYGSVTLFYKNIRFEITTFRKELKYESRKPVDIEYTDDFIEDIKRRDFVINTMCMNSQGEIIDLLNGKRDIDSKIIRSVGDANIKFEEDPLRILRAIRFATQLNFEIDTYTLGAIKNNMHLLKGLSYQRKKDELNKIFISKNIKYGLKLMSSIGVGEYLDLYNLDKIKITSDVIGIWGQLNDIKSYSFSKLERNGINDISKILESKIIGTKELYTYGLYTCCIAAEILGISKKTIVRMNKLLPINSVKDIDITSLELCETLNRKPGEWLRGVYDDLENKIVGLKLKNKKDIIKKYIIKNMHD